MDSKNFSAAPPGRRAMLTNAIRSGLALAIGVIAGGAQSSAQAQTGQPQASILHIAINVADMERTTRFYTEAFGFTASPPITPDGQAARIFGLPTPIEVKARFLSLGSVRVLVRQFDKPKYAGPARDLPVIYPGWGDIALRVGDLEQVLGKVRRLGGTVLENTRTLEGTPDKPGPEVVFVTDPDGARVELVSF